jgi:predicted ATP-binding protein involved in virulence
MHIEHVRIENLGPIKTIDETLHERFNVFVGVNGAGKTTVLAALSKMLGRYASAVRTGKATGLFELEQIRKGAPSLSVEVTAIADGQSITWSARRIRFGHAPAIRTISTQLIAYAQGLAARIADSPDDTGLPIAVAYPVNRAVLGIPLRIRNKTPFEQLSALDETALHATRNFRTFFAWFRAREDVENERRIDNSKYRDPQLTAVRKAVEGLLPGFKNLRVRRQPLRMLVEKNGIDLRIDCLSDGEKGMLALAGDLAKRLAIANPGSNHPLEGTGVVLIDELELHLHPAWQRRAVTALQETFPNCQFIVTTHSPQVVSEVAPEGVFLLSEGKVIRPVLTLGRESGLILEELMESSKRPTWAQEEIDRVYDFIGDQKTVLAQEAFDKVAAKIGAEDPGLTTARRVLKSRPRISG